MIKAQDRKNFLYDERIVKFYIKKVDNIFKNVPMFLFNCKDSEQVYLQFEIDQYLNANLPASTFYFSEAGAFLYSTAIGTKKRVIISQLRYLIFYFFRFRTSTAKNQKLLTEIINYD